MIDFQLTDEEQEELKGSILKFINNQLDPKHREDRDPEGIRILPSLIEILTKEY